MPMRLLMHLLMAMMLALASLPAVAQHKHGEHKHSPRFDDPEKWAKSFDDPERADWQKPEAVIEALGLKADAKVADIGAGTGYFAIRLARAVPAGTVYAVDLEPRMVAYLAERARALGLANMKSLQGAAGSPNLPEPVDLVLLVNVYHHLDARSAYFNKLAASLKPGGRIAIIDQNEKAERGPPRHMRVSVRTIEEEMALAGFVRTAKHEFLPFQNFLVFESRVRCCS